MVINYCDVRKGMSFRDRRQYKTEINYYKSFLIKVSL
jgi:hypothetical protein